MTRYAVCLQALPFFICVICATSATASDLPEFDPVVKLFSGISYAEPELVKEATTDDFVLLEVGEVWDLSVLLSHVKPSDRQRENFFSVISVERFDEVAVINYWNKAVISAEEAESSHAWLESVVVVKSGSGWKITQMHSTRIEPAAIPGDVVLTSRMLGRP